MFVRLKMFLYVCIYIYIYTHTHTHIKCLFLVFKGNWAHSNLHQFPSCLLPCGGGVSVIRVLKALWICAFWVHVHWLFCCMCFQRKGGTLMNVHMSAFNRDWCYRFMTDRIHVWVAKAWFNCHIQVYLHQVSFFSDSWELSLKFIFCFG